MSRIHKPRRTLVIGDIHGCLKAFDTLMATVKPRSGDRIITLGDYVDRGPNSKAIIDRLIELHHRGQLVALRGNHELMMLRAREGHRYKLYHWLAAGGESTLASYSKVSSRRGLASIPDEHWNFLENTCVNWWETKSHFFVHANVYPNLPLHQQPERMLFWQQFANPSPHYSGKVMVCGHTSQKSGQPISLGHAICIDTWVYGRGWLTCLDIVSGRIWQANQNGQFKTAWIDDYYQKYYQRYSQV
ncbi:MAG: metallophosphoesterase family protein [Cyanobacteria bacterium J06592_8]|nr:metallophosphoesterase family protein [Cyanobacteriota bacterium]